MTDIRKSDAQLDAEASQPLEDRDLDAAIALHRHAFMPRRWGSSSACAICGGARWHPIHARRVPWRLIR
jgi:phosphoenolpyruvate synthase/pyruvate phosphate dikinase